MVSKFELKQLLEDRIINFLINIIGYEDEEQAKQNFIVSIKDIDQNKLRVEIKADLDYMTMMKLEDTCNDIIQQYDQNSYFDMEENGITIAYVNRNSEGKQPEEFDDINWNNDLEQ